MRIKAGRILAGAKLDSIENAALVVAAGKIVAIETETDAGGHVIDLGTATMMPGMIDCHMHTFGVDSMRLNTLATEREAYRAPRALFELRQMLEAGFTSARCLGSTIGTEVRRAIDEGFATGPRLKVAGAFISSTSGTWDSKEVPLAAARRSGELADGVDGVRQAVRERVRDGADFIKLGLSKGGVHDRYHAWGDDPLAQIATYSADEVRAAVDEAHRNRLKVSAHAIGEAAVALALECDVDIVEHGYGISEATREKLVNTGTIVVSTISQLHFHRLAYDLFHYPDWERAVYERHWDIMKRDFQLGLKAGVRFALGTDLVGAPTHPLKEAANEFILAVDWGMTALQALQAGTVLSAEVLGIAGETGTIEPGKAADLVAFAGNPLDDISVVMQPLFVMKQGVTIIQPSRQPQ
nr:MULTISPECIES: amidohydrolase family protein [unclassified Rhizobium]